MITTRVFLVLKLGPKYMMLVICPGQEHRHAGRVCLEHILNCEDASQPWFIVFGRLGRNS